MKKLFLALALVAAVGCTCSVPKKSIEQVKASVELSRKDHLRYVEADSKATAKEKDDWKKFYESQIRNIEAIEKAHE